MAGVLYWVLNMSVWGTVTGLAVLLLRRIRRLPRGLVYGLWLLPLARLWMPVAVSSPLSLQNLLAPYTVRTVTVWQSEWRGMWIPSWEPQISASNALKMAETYTAYTMPVPFTYKTDVLARVFMVGGMVWASVTAALLLGAFWLYRRHMRELRRMLRGSERVARGVYRSAAVTAPAVYGMLRQRILLPPDGAAERYVLLHERVHVRRRDNLWRAAAVVTACVHWFNPLVWVMLPRLFADMELACDARALRGLDAAERRAYAGAVLMAADRRRMLVSGFGGAGARTRITRILGYRRLSAMGMAAALLFAAAVTVALLTNR